MNKSVRLKALFCVILAFIASLCVAVTVLCLSDGNSVSARADVIEHSNTPSALAEDGKETLAVPSVVIVSEGEGKNDVYTGEDLTATLSGYDSALMTASFNGQTVSGENIKLTARNAGDYTVKFTLKDSSKYCWDSASLNKNGEAVSVWTVAKRKVAIPQKSRDEYSLTGYAITYELTGFDEELMEIKGNEGTFRGRYIAVISLKDTDNYVWDFDSAGELDDNVRIDTYHGLINYIWYIGGYNKIFVIIVCVLSILIVLAIISAVLQLLKHNKKKKEQEENAAAQEENGADGNAANADLGGATE